MDWVIAIVSSVVAGLVIATTLFLLIKRNDSGTDENSVLMVRLESLSKVLDDRLAHFQTQLNESSRDMQSTVRGQFGESQKIIDKVHEQLLGVTREITTVNESSKHFLDVADQLKDLERILKHQKQRGNWGEASLKLALENFLTQNDFEMQYTFPDGETVDAIIKTPEGIIPVDAKFSLDNYQRYINAEDKTLKTAMEAEFKKDLKKRIDETSKYIREKDRTLPFAIMYIPAEGIYYDLLVNDIGTTNSRKLIDYAYKDKNVVIASPTTFLAYLQTILHGFRAFKFQKSINDVKKNVDQLQVHLNAYQNSFTSVGKSLNAAVNHYDRAQTQYRLIDKDVVKINGKSINFDKMEMEHPRLEEGE